MTTAVVNPQLMQTVMKLCQQILRIDPDFDFPPADLIETELEQLVESEGFIMEALDDEEIKIIAVKLMGQMINLTQLMDLVGDGKAKTTEANKRAELMKEASDFVQTLMIQHMLGVGLERAGNDRYLYAVSPEDFPTASDWDQISQWIKENDGLFLLQKRLNAGAYRDLKNQGIEIPGIQNFQRHGLSVRAAKSK